MKNKKLKRTFTCKKSAFLSLASKCPAIGSPSKCDVRDLRLLPYNPLSKIFIPTSWSKTTAIPAAVISAFQAAGEKKGQDWACPLPLRIILRRCAYLLCISLLLS